MHNFVLQCWANIHAYFDSSFWQHISDFFNSTFFAAAFGSGAAAFAGAWGAQRIITRNARRGELLIEIRNTNATIMMAVGTCNSSIGIKKQHVKRLKEAFDAQKAAYLDHVEKCRTGQIPIRTPFRFLADFQSLLFPPFPVDILQRQIFEKLSLTGRPIVLVSTLSETVQGLHTAVERRNELIEFYKAAQLPETELVPLYFGLRQGSRRVVNEEYPALLDAIYHHTDDGIFFSKLLADDLYEHGRQLAAQFKATFGKDAPARLNKPDFSLAEKAGLMPDTREFSDWLNMVTKKESVHNSARRPSRILRSFGFRRRG